MTLSRCCTAGLTEAPRLFDVPHQKRLGIECLWCPESSFKANQGITFLADERGGAGAAGGGRWRRGELRACSGGGRPGGVHARLQRRPLASLRAKRRGSSATRPPRRAREFPGVRPERRPVLGLDGRARQPSAGRAFGGLGVGLDP